MSARTPAVAGKRTLHLASERLVPGPASERDLSRWSTLTLAQIRSALADLSGQLERVDVALAAGAALPLAVAAVRTPVTMPRRATNHRDATVLAKTLAMQPEPVPSQ